MEQQYKRAFSEVNAILKIAPDEIVSKIPKKFLKILEDEEDKEYKPNIQEPIKNYKLTNETILILGLIYRDFLCPPEERKRLQEKDQKELEEARKLIELEKREKYNPDKLFENRGNNNFNKQEIAEKNKSIIVKPKEKWYQKIFSFIKRFYRKKLKNNI